VRAVVVSPSPGNAGGAERTSSLIARALTDRGWDVAIAAPDEPPPQTVRRAGAAGLWSSRRLMASVPATSGLQLLITCGELGSFAPAGVPRIHIYHGTMVEHTLRGDLDQPLRERVRRVFGNGLAEGAAGRGATTVAVSESAAREVRRYFRLAVDEVIPNGVDVEVFRPRDRAEARSRFGLAADGRCALFVGRTEVRKGADLLLPACERAGFELLVAGRSTLEGARELGILSAEDTAWAYSAADCVLFPTRYEACSWVVLEALASGTPLLTTRVGWMETFLRELPEYRALCVWPEVADVAARLRSLADADHSELTGAARRWMERWGSYDAFAERWGALAERVAAKDGGGGHGMFR
jgi:glycosyltransferase involved in cell wall biosynthesis